MGWRGEMYGNRLRELRISLGYTQKQLADRLGRVRKKKATKRNSKENQSFVLCDRSIFLSGDREGSGRRIDDGNKKENIKKQSGNIPLCPKCF